MISNWSVITNQYQQLSYDSISIVSTCKSVTNKGSITIRNTHNLSTSMDMLINWTKSVYLTITCYCNTTHELLQFYINEKSGKFPHVKMMKIIFLILQDYLKSNKIKRKITKKNGINKLSSVQKKKKKAI